MFKLCASILATVVVSLTTAYASPYPVHIQRQRGEMLVIEHTPVPGRVKVRRVYPGKIVRLKRRVRRARNGVTRRSNRVIGSVSRDERVFWTGAIAGGCRDGGFVRRRLVGSTVTLQREVCRSIAPNLPTPAPKLPFSWW